MRHGALMSRLWVGTSFNTASGTDCMQLKEEFHHEKQCDQGFNTASGTDCMQWTALLIRKELVAVMSFNTASGTDCMQYPQPTFARIPIIRFNTASGTDCMQFRKGEVLVADYSVSIPQAVRIACNFTDSACHAPHSRFNTASGTDCMQ